MSELSSPSKSLRTRSSAMASASRQYYARIGRRKIMPGIPKAANWGWGHLPLPAKIMIAGVLCGVVSLTTPYWAYIKAEMFGLSTFGLWHYCSGEVCNSIHDNLIEGQSVEAWFHFTQGSMCIGVACSIVSLAMLTNSIEGRVLRMTPTVHVAVSSILAISALEHFVALMVFANYLESSGFLFTIDSIHRVDLYGSYYLGVASLVCSLVGAFVVFLSHDVTGRQRGEETFDFSNPEHLKLLQEFCYKRGYLDCEPEDFGHSDGFGPAPMGYVNGGYEGPPVDLNQPENDGWYESPRRAWDAARSD